jgi:hypothetical protein
MHWLLPATCLQLACLPALPCAALAWPGARTAAPRPQQPGPPACPRLAQAHRVLLVHSEDAAADKAPLQQVHAVVPHQVELGPGEAVCRLLRVHPGLVQHLGAVDVAHAWGVAGVWCGGVVVVVWCEGGAGCERDSVYT